MIYLGLIVEELAIIAVIVLLLKLVLQNSSDRRTIKMRDVCLLQEDLEELAIKSALEHTIEKRRNPSSWPIKRMYRNYEYILSVYKSLNAEVQQKRPFPTCGEWLLDNFYVIDQHVKIQKREYNGKSYARLPVLQNGPLEGYSRIFAVIADLVSHTDGKVEESSLADYLRAYQTKNNLFEREICAVPCVLRFALIEKITILCEKISEIQKQRHFADEIYYEWLNEETEDADLAMKHLKGYFQSSNCVDPIFVEHLLFNFRQSGKSYAPALKTLEAQLSRYDENTEHLISIAHDTLSAITISISNSITSLIRFSSINWDKLLDSCSSIEKILINDPDGTYQLMDHCSRAAYKRKIEELSIKYKVSELFIAKEILSIASSSYNDGMAVANPSNAVRKTWHVGYYLLDKGFEDLRKKEFQKRDKAFVIHNLCQKCASKLYLCSAFLITMIIVSYFVLLSDLEPAVSILLSVLLLFPCSEIALQAINLVVCRNLKPAEFLRLDFVEGIPENASTIVVMPTLFSDTKQVEKMLVRLEAQFLANRDDNLFFAIISAFKDSDGPKIANSDAIINTALSGIKDLNGKYAKADEDKFYFFHRSLQYNKRNNKWIGWERKRGALLEFNDLVLGSTETSFEYLSSKDLPFTNVKYIITLDSDTVLPFGMARKMISTMVHPLNWPVIDEKSNVVVSGYGIMQPRIVVDVESVSATAFSRIFVGQKGIDPYANAISDVYQDLFGEAIFTGKGIYDLQVFQQVLKGALPNNVILSHDLLEGSFLRTGLVTDTNLLDSTPATYGSYMARLFRWVRGDWQLLPFIYGKHLRHGKRKLHNPLSGLSRWKMIDNLRRSLVAPALMIFVAISLFAIKMNFDFWFGFFVFALVFPNILPAITYLVSGHIERGKTKNYILVMGGLHSKVAQIVLALYFLPYNAWLMTKAVFVTLARVYITKKNLLEWTTSADVERNQKNDLPSYVRRMQSSIISAVIIFALTILFHSDAIWLSLITCILWASAPFVAYTVSKPQKNSKPYTSDGDFRELGRITRKTWRFFEEFIDEKGHYLVPDNYQEDPPKGVAYRTSPTNIGLQLLSTLASRDFGYTGLSEMVEILESSISTIEKIEKINGHLYNWYDTRTLKSLNPRYISTVDSGNLLACLITLRQGLEESLTNDIASIKQIDGIRDTLSCAGIDGEKLYGEIDLVYNISAIKSLNVITWSHFLFDITNRHAFSGLVEETWKLKLENMVEKFSYDLALLAPWTDLYESVPNSLTDNFTGKAVAELTVELKEILSASISLESISSVCEKAGNCIRRLKTALCAFEEKVSHESLDWLSELEQALETALEASLRFAYRIEDLILRIDRLADSMNFAMLFDEKRQLFSIGYNADENALSNSYYDILASEARITSYICIARGIVPATHWFRMGRSLTSMNKYKGLVSWTGTMFEYLMPLLFMKSYKYTLLDETYSFILKNQKIYGQQRNMPWGCSESQFFSLDINQDYQYKAIGVPWLGLKRGLIEDAVITPYATFLSLLVDPKGSLKNIKYLLSEGLEGPYGLYEAADYTPERLIFENRRTIVKSFMAHHQGMSLVALDDFLNNNIMQERFNSDHENNAARLLLQEKVPDRMVILNETKERVIPYIASQNKDVNYVRRYYCTNNILPKVHILSNGNYSVLLTDKGTGYSKNKMVSVTRWREDSTEDQYGVFFFYRNVNTDEVWPSACMPSGEMPDQYEVVFTADKASYTCVNGKIKTKSEIIVATGDNVEIRRVTLKNTGDEPAVIELTSYCEPVLTNQSADESHPAFSNLFVETFFDQDKKALIATRRPRAESDKKWCVSNSFVIKGIDYGGIQYETDRMQFIGRGNSVNSPLAIKPGKPLSNSSGIVLDPIMSLRTRVRIDPKESAQIALIISVSENEELLMKLIDKYSSIAAVESAFDMATARSQAEMKYLDIDGSEIQMYQDMMSHVMYLSPTKKAYENFILNNTRGQSALWKYGISGDLPIVLFTLKDIQHAEILYRMLKAHEYWQLIDFKVDLVVLDEEEFSYSLPIQNMISDILMARKLNASPISTPGSIYVLNKNILEKEDLELLYSSARLVINGNEGIEKQLEIPLGWNLPQIRSAVMPAKKYESKPLGKNASSRFNNGLGGFSPSGEEYIIHLKDNQNSPAPWINVIANPTFGFIVSESGAGYTWYQNSRENKITPWTNDAVSDTPNEIIYLCDTETNKSWTITPLPIREHEPYRITHGFGYTVFEHNSNGFQQRLTQFVPKDDPVKLSMVNVINSSEVRRTISLTYYVRPVLGVSNQNTALHITTSLDSSGAIFIRNTYNEEFSESIYFMNVSHHERTVTGNRKEFFGTGGVTSPDCLSRECLSGVLGNGFDPCGAMQIQIVIEPWESRDILFILGAAKHAVQAQEYVQKYKNTQSAERALDFAKTSWKAKVGTVKVDSSVEKTDIMINGWLVYQTLSCRLWARSAFYQSGGAYGFRDQLQDCLAVVYSCPDITRDQILLHAAHQFVEGDVQHWWHEPLGKGIRSRCSDDLLWLPYVTSEYIRITDDYDILDEEVPFLEDTLLGEKEYERYGRPTLSGKSGTLFDHCIRAIDISLKFGKHGLPLMGTCDWNDGMNAVGQNGIGESVWLGWFLADVLKKFAPICESRGLKNTSSEYLGIKAMLVSDIENNAWDGGWYRRAYFDNGQPLGSLQNDDCKIDSITQTWAVISGEGNLNRAVQSMSALDDYLIDREKGIIKLLAPPFDKGRLSPGYIKGYVPGIRENGGQYTHAAIWVIIAYALLGDGEKAWELYEMINPISHTASLIGCHRYKLEPYVLAADVYSAKAHAGRGGWSWYTGSSGWAYRAGLEYLLGFKKNGKFITMDPCIPTKLEEYSIVYRYFETFYSITVKNPNGVNKGVKIISVDGIVLEDKRIKLVDDGNMHDVEVLMG